MTTRRVTYHVLKFFRTDNHTAIYNGFDFEPFRVWFNGMQDSDKLFDISDNKFTSIDLLEPVERRYYQGFTSVYFGMFSTGNYGSRRNLKNSSNNSKRENPKLIEEGEEQENYFLLCFRNHGDAEIVLQCTGRGVKSVNIKNYFDNFFNRYLFENEQEKEFLLKEGSIVETTDLMIDRLERVTTTKVYIDKKILTDDHLNITNRIVQAKADLVIDVRAQRNQDIRDILNDIRQNIVYKTMIEKIWVEGKDSHGNPNSFYIDQVQKSVFVDIDADDSTAAIVRQDVKTKLLQLI